MRSSEWTKIGVAALVAVIAVSFLVTDALIDASGLRRFTQGLESVQVSFIKPSHN
jgi:hypothetical protein